MNLRLYLDQKRQSVSAFAVESGFAPSTVARWLNGTQRPELDQVRRLIAVTRGAVTAADLRPDWAEVFGVATSSEKGKPKK
jgi:DNA-binding transcriptional regulator YdaS (Cro superfamily)